uniref:SPK domain-containing protein n=1 Tax=Caenorhabditis tropicalis TaxID=1561998 RepID=A0A1I7U225_9PELO
MHKFQNHRNDYCQERVKHHHSPLYSSCSSYENFSSNYRCAPNVLIDNTFRSKEREIGFLSHEVARFEHLLRPSSAIEAKPRIVFNNQSSVKDKNQTETKNAENRGAHMEWTQNGLRFWRYDAQGKPQDDEDMREKVEKNIHRMEYEYYCEKMDNQRNSKIHKMKNAIISYCEKLRRNRNGPVSPGDISLKDENGPKILDENSWSLDDADLLSVQQENGKVTKKAMFLLLHKKVGKYNWSASKKSKITLLHPQFFPDFQRWVVEKSGKSKKSFDADKYMSFREPNSTTFLVPFFESNGQFVLMTVGRNSKGRLVTQHIDSSLKKRSLSSEQIELLADSLFERSVKNRRKEKERKAKDCHFSKSMQIQKQSLVVDSAILGILNAEVLLETKDFINKFGKFCPKRRDDPNCTVETVVSILRLRLAEELDRIMLEQKHAHELRCETYSLQEQSSAQAREKHDMAEEFICQNNSEKTVNETRGLNTKFVAKLDVIVKKDENVEADPQRSSLFVGKKLNTMLNSSCQCNAVGGR